MWFITRCIPIAVLLANSAALASPWHVNRIADPMTDHANLVATVLAPGAFLRVTCSRTGPTLVFDQPMATRTVGVSYRFDNGPVVPRVAVVGSDFRTVYPWLATAGAARGKIARSSRLRVQVFPGGYFNFDLTGSGDVVRALGCDH